MFSQFNQITRNATVIDKYLKSMLIDTNYFVSVDPLCTDDDMLKYIVQSVGVQCDQVLAHICHLENVHWLIVHS